MERPKYPEDNERGRGIIDRNSTLHVYVFGGQGLEFERHIKRLKKASPYLFRVIRTGPDMKAVKKQIGIYLSKLEFKFAEPDGSNLDNIIAREAINVMRRIIAPGNERAAGYSAIQLLRDLLRGRYHKAPPDLSKGFFEEFRHLFLAIERKTKVYKVTKLPRFLRMKGRKAAIERSRDLDELSSHISKYLTCYMTGLDGSAIRRRAQNRNRILKALGGTKDDWTDWRWHIRNVAKTSNALSKMVKLADHERKAINKARRHRLPFGVTPYYAHLMDNGTDRSHDHAVRAQVIPSMDYVDTVVERKCAKERAMDFMGEVDTSPIDLITRRYPNICIFKPYNTCPQICVYCQRNWEIDEALAKGAMASKRKLDEAYEWLEAHPSMQEVLVTGGDPLVIPNKRLREILERLGAIEHIERIRIGTRLPVTIPFRIDDGLIEIIQDIHQPPRREFCLITHVEHVYEVTPELQEAIHRVRRCGVSVYNQLVYTFENSRRFEASALRLMLRKVGITPYYTFNTKGKEETRHFRVPIARILQESKEEARLLPGVVRTDVAVFNIPRLGKNYLSRGQHHDVISILPDGRRVYEFHPWEKKIRLTETFTITDVPIHEYLERLRGRGEDPKEYGTIWYYY